MPPSGSEVEALDHEVALGFMGPSVVAKSAPPPTVELTGVSLVIPAWNEEQRLPNTLEQYLRLLEGNGNPFEVIVVADGVTDRTVEVARKFSGRHVRVLTFDRKLGKGGAILQGFKTARFDTVGFVDADAPITAADLASLLSELAEVDCAIASRWVRHSVGPGRRTLSRVVFSRAWNFLTRAILDLPLSDTQCGAKCFRREPLVSILNQVKLTNWAFDASLLFHFSRAGYRVMEVPVTWSDHPASKMRLERAIPAMFFSIVGIRLMSLPRLRGYAQSWASRMYRWID